MRPRVFDVFGREIALDDEHQVLRDGMRVTVPLLLQDHDTIQKGDPKMTTDTITIDGQVMTKDAAIAHLQRKVDGLEGRLAATDAIHAAPRHDLASGAQVRDHMAALERGKRDPQTPAQKRAFEIANAWKTGGRVA